MADTQSANLQLTIQTPGGNSNTWGTLENANLNLIDAKFGSVTSLSTTGGTTTLSAGQEEVGVLLVTGVLVSDATIVFSGRGGTWLIKNSTTGAFAVTCKVSGQSGVAIAQGTGAQPIYCTGADIDAGGAQSSATSIPAGFGPVPYCGTTAPTGWVRANGRTIGNASSNAVERANADTSGLYTVIWNSYSNTICPIQDSAGTPTARGVSAAADYAANRRLTLPDLRGRAVFGLDDMGNSAAGRLGSVIASQTTLGSSGGTETVTLDATMIPAHTHSLSVSGTTSGQSADHTHTGSGTTSGQSQNHTHSVTVSSGGTRTGSSGADPGSNFWASSGNVADFGPKSMTATSGNPSVDHTHTFSFTSATTSNDHTHTVTSTGTSGSTGGGLAHSNMPPAWLVTYIIKL